MKKLLFALAAFASLFSAPAYAATAAQAFIVSACGSLPSGLTYAASTYGIITMDTTGELCDSATGGSGGTSATYGAAFPSVGTPSGGTDGTNFQPLVVDTTTHYLQVDVKAGGAGGGAVYGPTAVGTAAANPPVLTGGTADGTGTGAVSVWKIVSGVGYANTAQINGVTILTGAGAAGTGSERVAVGQDTTTIAGSAPGINGSAVPANGVLIQGSDGTDARNISTDSSGHQIVEPGNTANTTAWLVGLNATPTIANGNGVVPTQGGNALSATNGWYGNILQGNAVLSATNPIFTSITDGTNKAAVKPASTPPASTDPSLVVAINPNSINANGQTTKANSAPVTIASDQYGDPCQSGVAKSSVAIAITSAATAQLIALSGSTVIYVCGFTATIPNTATTATSLKFIAGTGSNCGTLTATLTGAMGSNDAAAVSANPVVLNYGGANATVFATPAGSELCTVAAGNGTLALNGVLTYVQQ